ncbi:hypothetical protein M3Y94_01064600 [Aphelenchoides besseyi]|nr:hypothetical protein M3Y94_01064600 [Aphelenchoides besseyi]KAI6224210.1 hypothetical protein M3Y95_00858800 [Aphelenchoides besseyi]
MSLGKRTHYSLGKTPPPQPQFFTDDENDEAVNTTVANAIPKDVNVFEKSPPRKRARTERISKGSILTSRLRGGIQKLTKEGRQALSNVASYANVRHGKKKSERESRVEQLKPIRFSTKRILSTDEAVEEDKPRRSSLRARKSKRSQRVSSPSKDDDRRYTEEDKAVVNEWVSSTNEPTGMGNEQVDIVGGTAPKHLLRNCLRGTRDANMKTPKNRSREVRFKSDGRKRSSTGRPRRYRSPPSEFPVRDLLSGRYDEELQIDGSESSVVADEEVAMINNSNVYDEQTPVCNYRITMILNVDDKKVPVDFDVPLPTESENPRVGIEHLTVHPTSRYASRSHSKTPRYRRH